MNISPLRGRVRARRDQRGTVLIIALIVLVAMTLAGIATMRSVDTATLLAGNIGLRQATSNAADQGIQSAAAWLTANLGATLDNDNLALGYHSSVAVSEPDWSDSSNWTGAFTLNSGNPDAGGNVVTFLIHRMCSVPNCGSAATCPGGTNTCASTLASSALSLSGFDQTRPTDTHTSAPAIHYRITAKAVGPRNSVSIVQTLVKAI